MWLGVDYYPEQWDEALLDSDLDTIAELGCNVIRIAEFAWNKFENEEGVFTFDFFDRFLDVVEQTDMKVIFCTPTATPPAWLTQKYPEVLQADQDGHIFYHGCRRHYNYNAPVYLEKTRIIVEELAQHYADRKCIVGWQIDNELNCQIGEFFSEADSAAFRVFLKEKYGTLNKLNEAWGTVFWNQTYTDWSQIYLPRHTPHNTSNPHLKLDSLRFYSESCISYCKLHYDILKKYLPKNVFVTTQGLFPHVNYNRLHDEALDFLTYDSYPMFGLSDEGGNRLKDRKWSMELARIRGAGNEFGIMEQQSGANGWNTRMEAPAVRVAKTMNTPHGDAITVFDLRFCVPNKEVMPERGIHTLEHLFAGFMRNHLNGNGVEIIDISPMGCRTGFYMSLIGTPDEQRVADAWKAAMEDVLKVQDQNQIPELNVYQCGTYQMHSLQEAQDIARNILERDVRINSNEELALPKEKLQELHI